MQITDWLHTKLGQDIWNGKYKDNESLDEWLDRISGGNTSIRQLIVEKKFLFGGRILASRGLQNKGRKISLSNCYVMTPPEDNIESIFDCAKKLARTYSYGGGCGVDISKLAPRNAKINNAAKATSGSISFIDLYSLVTKLIGQQGRRGALMVSLNCDHPDLEEFINLKSDLNKATKANISIRVNDKFMEAVKNNSDWTLEYVRKETGEKIGKVVNAKKIFNLLAKANWNYAEPGLINWDRICNWSLLSEDSNFEYAGVNPCLAGDTLIQTADGNIPIKDLVGQRPFVYCMDTEGDLTIKQAKKVWLTRKNAELVKVITSKGEIICTPNHRIYTINHGWVEAKDLKIGNKIKGLNRQMMGDKYCGVALSGGKHVQDVIKLDYTEDVYDMTVPEVHNFIANDMVVHNCAEEPLPAGGSCLLGSINLSEFIISPFTNNAKFNHDDLKKVVAQGVIALNEVLHECLPLHPLEEQRKSVNNWRQIGLGIFGWHDALIKLGIRYGSEDSLILADTIGFYMINTAIATSAQLADVYGKYPMYDEKAILLSDFLIENTDVFTKSLVKEKGLANSQIMTIAPTGSTATMFGVSTGIEPIYNIFYTRKTESLHSKDEYYKVYTPIVEEYMIKNNITDENDLPDYFNTAMNLNYKERIEMQSIWQQCIDASISSTVNLPNNATVEDVENLYMLAWEKGLKGVTIYRDGCKRDGVLTNKEDIPSIKKEESLAWGTTIQTSEDLIGKKRKIMSGCGSLHVLAWFDPENGKLVEIYLSKGSMGGCNAFMVALSRTISAGLRTGMAFDYAIDQLKSAPACPSYAVRAATKKDTSKGNCCPAAVANVLDEMQQEVFNELGTHEEDDEVTTKELEIKFKCPECGESLAFQGGCNQCGSCGYSKCE